MNKIALYYDFKKIVVWAETAARFKILKQWKYSENNLSIARIYLRRLEKNDNKKETIYKSI